MQQSLLRHAICLLLAAYAVAGASPQQFHPAAALERGMRGMGKTVFHGTAIDTFGVEILGVARNGLGPQRDLILARLSGGPLAETGIIAGMSGSPVYVDGRLVGAVAYGWAFSKAPICGITPIAEMLEVMARPLQPRSGPMTSPMDVPGPGTTQGFDAAIFTTAGLHAEHLAPLATPVSLSGLTPTAAARVGEVLAPYGLAVQTAPGGTSADSVYLPEPGSALGVQFIAGDMSATGIGTVTYVEGNRVVAFGHRLGLAGAIEMPMTSAFIHQIIPNQVVSFKLGAAAQRIGAVRQDRAAAIAGLLGSAPAVLPVTVSVSSPRQTRRFSFELLRHRELTSGLAGAVLIGSMEAAEKLAGDATLDLTGTVLLAGGEQLSWSQVFGGPGAILRAARRAVAPLGRLTRSEVADVELDSVHFAVELREKVQTATIEGLRAPAAALRAGQTFQLEVLLRPYRGDRERVRFEMEVPPGLTPGPMRLRVGGGEASRGWEQQRRPDALKPRNLAQLLRELEAVERNDDLVVELYRDDASVSVDGRELPGLPPSIRRVLDHASSSGYVGPVFGRVLRRAVRRTDYVLQGDQKLELEVIQ